MTGGGVSINTCTSRPFTRNKRKLGEWQLIKMHANTRESGQPLYSSSVNQDPHLVDGSGKTKTSQGLAVRHLPLLRMVEEHYAAGRNIKAQNVPYPGAADPLKTKSQQCHSRLEAVCFSSSRFRYFCEHPSAFLDARCGFPSSISFSLYSCTDLHA